MDLRPRQVDHLTDLMEVVLRVGFHFLGGQLFAPRVIAPARVSHQSRVVADDDHRLMTQLLELAQFSEWHRVAEMDINAGRIDAVFDPQWFAGLSALGQLRCQFLFRHDLLDTTPDDGQLFVNGQKTHGRGTRRRTQGERCFEQALAFNEAGFKRPHRVCPGGSRAFGLLASRIPLDAEVVQRPRSTGASPVGTALLVTVPLNYSTVSNARASIVALKRP